MPSQTQTVTADSAPLSTGKSGPLTPNIRNLAVGVAGLLLIGLNLLLSSRLPLQRMMIGLKARDAGVASSIAAIETTWAFTPVNTEFPERLKVLVTDPSGKPLKDAMVMFGAPREGPGASFGGAITATAMTNSQGIAVAPGLTANNKPGGYNIAASVTGSLEAPAYFTLMNSPVGDNRQAPMISGSAARRDLRAAIVFLDECVLIGAALFATYRRYRSAATDKLLFSTAAAVGLSTAVFIIIATFGRDEYFAPVETLMTNPQSLPVYGQRLLMVWAADFIKLLLPSLSYRRSFLAVQLFAIFSAVWATGKWSALFIGDNRKLLGQLLMVIMLIPTINYTDFYDIPMIAVYTASLYLLYKKRYAWFVIVLAIGTLNHENTLLLVPVAALILWNEASRRISITVPLAALIVWVAVRTITQRLIPEASHFEFHLWTNIVAVAHPTAELIKSLMALVFWIICAAIGFSSAERFVRKSAILLPALLAVTLVAGRLVEARQFDAFIPVAIALILSHLRTFMQLDCGEQARGSGAALLFNRFYSRGV